MHAKTMKTERTSCPIVIFLIRATYLLTLEDPEVESERSGYFSLMIEVLSRLVSLTKQYNFLPA